MYMPENYDRKELNEKRKLKKILIYDNKGRFNNREVPNGQAKFLADNCPVNTCEIVRDTSQAETADAILFKVSLDSVQMSFGCTRTSFPGPPEVICRQKGSN